MEMKKKIGKFPRKFAYIQTQKLYKQTLAGVPSNKDVIIVPKKLKDGEIHNIIYIHLGNKIRR